MDVFEDKLSQLPGVVHLDMDPRITSHIAATRRVPLAIKGKLKTELNRLVNKKVTGPVTEQHHGSHRQEKWETASLH